jgi:hypothetical protein
MANPALRDSAPANLPLTFVSKSRLGACERLHGTGGPGGSGGSGEAGAGNGADEVRSRFLRWLQRPDLLSPPRCGDGGVPVGERVPLSYDAAILVVQAVERLATRLRIDQTQRWEPRSINPATVHAEILGRNQLGAFPGVTGSIRFDSDSGEPVDKRISLLQVRSIPDLRAPQVEVFHCGVARPADDPACRRP